MLLLGVLFSAVALVVACGGGDDEDSSSSGSGGAATATSTRAAATSTTTSSSPTATASATTGAGGEGGSTTVDATLTEFKIALDKDSASAGEVEFKADNKGAIQHELVVIKSDLAPDKLPVGSAGTVDESKVDVVGKIDPFDAGKTETKSLDLEAGKYVLICDIAGHYAGGMHAAFTVQ
jgi:uncharacterized cupredoxin-like copper-binding protein